MTLDELSEAWTTLRNDALGRGVAPNVKPALARNVELQYSAWRKALMHMPPAADMMASYFSRRWVMKYRKLRAQVKASGVTVTSTLPETTFETLLVKSDRFGQNIALGAGIGGVVLIGFMWATRRRGNGR